MLQTVFLLGETFLVNPWNIVLICQMMDHRLIVLVYSRAI
jgi:hypothetical protein